MSVVLSDEEVRLYYTEIALGQRRFVVEDSKGKERQGYYQQPTSVQRLEGIRIYKETYAISIEHGIRTRKQLERDFLNRYEFLTPIEQQKLLQNEAERKVLERQIMKLELAGTGVLMKQYKEELEEKEQEYYLVLSKKTHYYMESAEQQAEQAQVYYYVARCVPDIWNSPVHFSKERDKHLVLRVVTDFTSFIRGFDQSTLRAIARHPEIRTRWRISKKTGAPFFGIPMTGGADFFAGPTSTWNPDQVGLCSWLMYYDDVTEAFEAPDWLIRDDKKLDEWVEKKAKQREAERIKKLGTGSRDAFSHQDVIVFDEEKDLIFADGSPYLESFKNKTKAYSGDTSTISDEKISLRRK